MSPSKSESLWASVDHYLNDTLLPPDPTLDAVLSANKAAQLPSIDVAPNQGKLLQLLAETQQARRILEIGTLGGYSTICLARALPAGGKLITLELDPHHAEVARGNLRDAGVLDRVEIRVGPANETLPGLVNSAPFDLIFIDADKRSYPEYLGWALKLARVGTILIADNVVRQGKVANPKSKDANVRGVQRFTEMLAAEPRLSATVLQTVGAKGYDGFALAVVVS